MGEQPWTSHDVSLCIYNMPGQLGGGQWGDCCGRDMISREKAPMHAGSHRG